MKRVLFVSVVLVGLLLVSGAASALSYYGQQPYYPQQPYSQSYYGNGWYGNNWNAGWNRGWYPGNGWNTGWHSGGWRPSQPCQLQQEWVWVHPVYDRWGRCIREGYWAPTRVVNQCW